MDRPVHDPDALDAPEPARPTPSGVRRVNDMPLLIAAAVLAAVVLIAASVAYDRAAEVGRKAPERAVAVDADLAEQVLGASAGRTGGLVDMPEAAEPSPPVLSPPSSPAAAQDDPVTGKLRAERGLRLQNAIAARTSAATQFAPAVAAGHERAEPAAVADAEPMSAPRQAQPDEAAVISAEGSSPARSAAAPAYGRFDRRDPADRWRLDSRIKAPRTPFELSAGFTIPATLLSGINAELPGQIVAQVSQDVYDTATGRYRLIPRGTRLLGTYDASVAYGQRRVLIAWQRLVFPDGKAMDIGAMPGTDAAGYAGLRDKVDNRYPRLFGSALLMSGVIAGVSSAQADPRDDPYGVLTNTVLLQAIAQQLGRAAAEMIQRNLNISPTLEIRPGFRFNVMVVKDLAFDKPYRPFDY